MQKNINSGLEINNSEDQKIIPEAYMYIINALFEATRFAMKNGCPFMPNAYTVNSSTKTVISISMLFEKEANKGGLINSIKKAAETNHADFILIAAKAWTLDPDNSHRYEEIVKRYGSIAASPYAVDAISITLETYQGYWAAVEPTKYLDKEKNILTFETPDFEFLNAAGGNFSNLLPQMRK